MVLFQGALAGKVAVAVIAPGRVAVCVVVIQILLTIEPLLASFAVERMDGIFVLVTCFVGAETTLAADTALVGHADDNLLKGEYEIEGEIEKDSYLRMSQ